jgi:hypothetical protein
MASNMGMPVNNAYLGGPVPGAGAGAGAGGHGPGIEVYVPPPAAAPPVKIPPRYPLEELTIFAIDKFKQKFYKLTNLQNPLPTFEDVSTSISEHGKDALKSQVILEKGKEPITTYLSVDQMFEYLKSKKIINVAGLRDRACQHAVSETYIGRQLRFNNMLFILAKDNGNKIDDPQTQVTRTKTTHTYEYNIDIIGFILANRLDDTHVYLDVICGEFFGDKLLKIFLTYVTNLGVRSVKLSSLSHVLSYYPKHNFKFRQSCEGPVIADIPADMPSARGKSVYDLPEYMSFMGTIRNLRVPIDGRTPEELEAAAAACARLNPEVKADQKRYKELYCDSVTAQRGCARIDQLDLSIEGNRELFKETYRKFLCDQNGYSMVRCTRDDGTLYGGGKRRRSTRRNRKSKRSASKRSKTHRRK